MPGASLHIYGSQLDSGTVSSVTMGGKAATITSQSSTLLKVEVPSGISGPVDVTVETQTTPERFSVVTGGTGAFAPDSSLAALSGGDAARGDVDGDGDLDLLVTGRNDSGNPETQLYVNDGSGSFTAVSDGLPDLENGTVNLGDVDNDGDLDVLLTGVNGSGTTVTRLFTKDDGSLSYTASGISFTGVKNGGAALGDVEGDGDLDIVLAGDNGGSTTAALYTNDYVENGTLGFTSESVSLDGTTQSTVDLGDFNGDGDLDIVITGEDEFGGATTTLYTNDGGGTSFTSTSLSESVQNGAVAVGDVNNDQALDLVISGNTGGFGTQATTLLLNDGTGSFSAEQSLAGVENGTATLGDVNANGNLDLLLTGEQGGDSASTTVLYLGDGSSSPFSLPSASSTLSAAGIPNITNSAAVLGDFNGDGRLVPFIAGSGLSGPTGALYRPVLAPVSSTPPPNAESVPLSSSIDVTFNAAVADLAGLADSIQVVGRQSGAFAEADGTVGGTGTETLTYDPNQNFAPGEQVFVRLRPGIQSTGGLPIFARADFRFRAAASVGPAVFPTSRTVSSSENGARAVATGFLTGNGNLDLVVASTGDTEVTVYPGNGDGTFGPPNVLDTSIQARALALADVDGDGLLDIVVGSGENAGGSSGGDILRYYVNNGDGTFGGGTDITNGNNADDVRDLAVTDLNGDGAQDLVAATSDNSSILLYTNDGSGSFSETILTSSADDPRAVTVGDLNFNGAPDLVVGSVSDDNLSWYPNQGDGTFSSPKPLDGSAVNPRSLQTADFDQDGRPEVLSAERGDDGTAGDGRITVHDVQIFNNSISWVENTLATTDSVLTAIPADINADGLVDVVAGSVGGDSLVWYENTSTSGNPSFASGRALDTGRHNVQDILAGDFDGDGSLDPALAETGAGRVALYPNTEPLRISGFSPSRNVVGADTSLSELAITFDKSLNLTATADTAVRVSGAQTGPVTGRLELDGSDDSELEFIPDPATPFQPGENVSVSVLADSVTATDGTALDSTETFGFTAQSAPGPASFPADSTISTAADGAQSVHAADLDGDGDLDVLSASLNDDQIAWYENTGGGRFSAKQTITSSAGAARSVHTADLDGDGDLDVLSASSGDNKIAWYENDGNGSFSGQKTITTTAGGARSVYAADIDGDGDLDVLSASSGDNRIAWYENTGGGSFSSQKTITTAADGAHSVYAADINEDGDLDVLSASKSDDKIAWYENTGSGSFSSQKTIMSGAIGANSVYAADINGDGDLDVLSASQIDDKIAWYENTGGGSFSNRKTITSAAQGAQSVYAADIDGDGDLDVLSASSFDNKIAWYENTGGGSFSDQQRITTAVDRARSVYVADISGDGTLDVLSASGSDDEIAWYPNTTTAPTAVTEAASSKTADHFTAEGTVNPGGLSTDVTFQYSQNGSFASDSSVTAGASPISGDDTTAVSATISGLDPGTTYNYRVVAENSEGTATGSAQSVTTTSLLPSGTADAAGSISIDSATLNATVNPGADTTRVYFDLENTVSGDSSVYAADTLRTNLSSDQSISFATPDTLKPGTSYQYEVNAANSADSVSLGTVSFTTPAVITGVQPGSGAPNTPVRIRGAGFSPTATNNTVMIGGDTAPIDSAKSTAIYAQVPSGPEGPSEVSVSVNGKTAAGSAPFGVVTDGSGMFGDVGASLTGVKVASSSIADVDGDGDQDLLIAGRDGGGSPVTTLYLQQSDGSFQTAGAGLTGVEQGATSIADVDGDGDQDLLVAGEGSGGTEVTALYLQQSDGSFQEASVGLSDVGRQASTSIADVDGDGNQDLLIGGEVGTSPTLTLYLQQSDGGFQAAGAGLTGVRGATSIADVNGDGDQDLLVVGENGSGPSATLYEQQSDGSFQTASAGLTGVSGFAATSIADVDGDGDQDLLIAGSEGTNPTTTLYLQKSDGSFQTANAGLTNVKDAATSIADIDGDGDSDLLIAGQDGSLNDTTILYEQQSDGSFQAASAGLTGLRWPTASIADVDGDGDQDLLVGGDDGGSVLTILYENFDVQPPSGTAETASNVTEDGAMLNGTVNPGRAPTRVYVDLQNTDTGATSVYAADTLTTNLTTDQSVTVPTPDTLKPNTGYEYTVSAANRADSVALGTESFTTIGPPAVTGTTPSRNTVGADTSLFEIAITFDKTIEDPTTDADTEVRVRGAQTGAVSGSIERDPDNTSELEFVPSRQFQPGEVASVSVLADSVTATDGTVLDSTDTFQFTAQAGDGPAQFPVDSTITTTADVPTSMKPADLDGDGDLDLAVAVNGSNTVAWYENDGTGSFPKQTITTDLSGVSSIYTTDIDGDGDPDLVASAEGNATGTDGQTISWFENQIGESGGFASRKIITNNVSEPAEVYAADVNGDGDPDVLSASWSDNRVAWYENQVGAPGADSDGFGAQQTIFQQSASYPQSVSAADLDGDGDLDVLTGSENDDRLAWHENQIGEPEADGDGFAPRQVISTAYDWPEPVQAADLNGDGRLDVLVASHQNNTVAWHENQGDGRFSAQKTIDNVPGATEVATGDLDGDDDLDIVLGASNGEVKWYENDGSGGFSPRTITGAFGKTGVVATADLDGDGTLDALSADKSGQQILWHSNTTIAPQVVTEAASDTTATSVTAEAKINPGGLDTEVTIQYSQNGTFGTDSSATAGASPLTGDDTTSVSITVSGLKPNTTYDYRVRTANSEGTTFGTSRSITTKIAPPQVTATATVDSDTSATITGTVNPGGDTTRVYMPLKRTGVPFTSMPLDTLRTALLSDTTFVVPVDTLRPSTEYRTRFVAANARDSISSGEKTFVTAPTTDPDTTEIAQRGGPRRLDVLNNDGAGLQNTINLDPSTVTVETGPDHGTATVDESDGSIRYEHDGSDTTADTLTYTVANAAGQRSAATTVALDIFDVQVQAGPATRGQPVPVALSVEGGFDLSDQTATRRLFFRQGGTTAYRDSALTTGPNDSLRTTLPDDIVTTSGIDYYVTLANQKGTLTIPAGGSTQRARRRPAHLPVSFEELSPTETVTEDFFQAETYRMVSVPAIPKGGLKAAFERSDAYGPYDANEWRLERWNASDGYDSYPAIDSLQAGDGFWLTTRRGMPFTLPQGRTVKADTIAEIPLAEGWNQIGTPFGFAVPWDTVRTASGFSTGDIDGPVGYRNGGFVPGRDSLAPWRGYFLYNATGSPDTLKVPPVGRTGSSASQALTAKSGATKASATETHLRPEAQLAAYEDGSSEKTNAGSGRYTLNVRAFSKGGTAEATLGLWPEAKAGRGPYDHAQPPSVTGGLRLSALETVNGTAVPHSHSIKPKVGGSSDSGGGRSWTLRLQALEDSGPTEAKLRLQGTGTLPSGHARYVLDLTNERRLTPGAELSLEGGETRRLKVLLGTEAYAKDHSEGISLKSLKTTLRANYPNPFDETTTVEYVVAEEQADGPVTIEIYNVLGQRVETLVDSRKAPGLHRKTWDGTNRYGNRVGSGVFFIRLRAGDVTETQKAVLVR